MVYTVKGQLFPKQTNNTRDVNLHQFQEKLNKLRILEYMYTSANICILVLYINVTYICRVA